MALDAEPLRRAVRAPGPGLPVTADSAWFLCAHWRRRRRQASGAPAGKAAVPKGGTRPVGAGREEAMLIERRAGRLNSVESGIEQQQNVVVTEVDLPNGVEVLVTARAERLPGISPFASEAVGSGRAVLSRLIEMSRGRQLGDLPREAGALENGEGAARDPVGEEVGATRLDVRVPGDRAERVDRDASMSDHGQSGFVWKVVGELGDCLDEPGRSLFGGITSPWHVGTVVGRILPGSQKVLERLIPLALPVHALAQP